MSNDIEEVLKPFRQSVAEQVNINSILYLALNSKIKIK